MIGKTVRTFIKNLIYSKSDTSRPHIPKIAVKFSKNGVSRADLAQRVINDPHCRRKVKHLLPFEICAREIYETFVYTRSETIKYVKKYYTVIIQL